MPEKEKRRKKKAAEPEEVPAAEAANEAQAAPPPPEPNRSKELAAQLTGAQKAAAVIVALGVEKASLLYQHMEPEEIEMVTIEVAKLGFLDADVTEEVLTEFYQMCMTNKAVTEGFRRPGREHAAGKGHQVDQEPRVLVHEQGERQGSVLGIAA